MNLNKSKKHYKDKPWDTDDIDHWKIEKFLPEHSVGPCLEESSFVILFPKYREPYLREVWPQLTKILENHGVACLLDLVQGSMSVKTTRKMYDPYIIMKARDVLKLLARSVPLANAIKVLEDGVAMDIIKIGNILRNKERFVKRRLRLIGPSGNTLKAVEILTKCFVLVQGNTVSAIGDYKGLKQVRRIVTDCMKNIHPVYHIKEMMIKRELAKDEKLKDENWDRFLPKFRKRVKISKVENKSAEDSTMSKTADVEKKNPIHQTRKEIVSTSNENNKFSKSKSKVRKEKKEYTPFPPPQTPRKEDLLLESGEYFLRAKERVKKKSTSSSIKNSEEKEKQKRKSFVPPPEKPYVRCTD